jgi:hypothetical protein
MTDTVFCPECGETFTTTVAHGMHRYAQTCQLPARSGLVAYVRDLALVWGLPRGPMGDGQIHD